MSVPEEELREAARIEAAICKKFLEIMDLQADIDGLLRDKPSPFGSAKWKNARPEELQRIVLMAALQFLLFEPDDLVAGNDKVQPAAGEMVYLVVDQMKWLKEKYH